MPTMSEVLNFFPNQKFAINDKDSDPTSISLLATALDGFSNESLKRLLYIGDNPQLARDRIPALPVISSRKETLQCLEWASLAWTGYIHASCRNTVIALPLKYALELKSLLPYLTWALHKADSKLMIFDVNSPEDARFVRKFDVDLVGTYRIDKVINALSSKDEKAGFE
jgi:hypothetical protein